MMFIMNLISQYALPVIIIIFLWNGFIKNVGVFDTFLTGAKKGLDTIIGILPSLLGLIVAVGVFRVSGALDLLVYAIRPIGEFIGIPPEILPLAFLRPISGSASLALVADELKRYGPDTYIGRVISTMMGSSETIFYTLAIYLGAVGIKKSKYVLPAAIITNIAVIILSVLVCNYV